MYSELLEELQKVIVDGDEAVFTLRGVDEYLRHPSSTKHGDRTRARGGTNSRRERRMRWIPGTLILMPLTFRGSLLILYKDIRPSRRRTDH